MKRKKNGLWIIITLAILLFATVGTAVYFILDFKDKADIATKLAEEKDQYIEENTRQIWTTMVPIKKGDILEEGVNVQLEPSLTALPDYVYIDDSYLGNVAVVDIDEYTPVFVNMVAKDTITDDLREVEIGVAQLNLNTSLNDYVDLRIRFATGSDYVVVAKKRIKAYDLKNSIFYTDLTESEILCLASATIDAYINTGTKIYLTTYEEPNLQKAAIPNYPVSEVIYNLMAEDPNIIEVAEKTLNLEARRRLAEYLGSLSEDYLDAVSDGEGLHDTAHSTAMSGVISYHDSDETYPSSFVEDENGEAVNKEDSTVVDDNDVWDYSLEDDLMGKETHD